MLDLMVSEKLALEEKILHLEVIRQLKGFHVYMLLGSSKR